ncbi:MAG: SCO family protein [Pseudomonadota bacterium]
MQKQRIQKKIIKKQLLGVFLIVVLVIFMLSLSWLPITSNRIIEHSLLKSEAPYTFIFFGFSTCHSVCPMTLNRLSTMSDNVLNHEVKVIYIEIVKHGNNDAANQYAQSFHKEFLGIAPEKNQLKALEKIFGLSINSNPDNPSHLGKLYLLKNNNGQKILFKTYNALKFSINRLLQDIESRL